MAVTKSAHINNITKTAWVVVLSASLFFFYEFIQGNMFNAISIPLLHAFSLDAGKLGYLSAFYFIANVIFLFPAGILLDRFATRKIILISLAVCVFGTFYLAMSHSFIDAAIARFLTGIGSAFCFLSVIRLATRWFPTGRMALVTGIVVTIAMIGGTVAQTPMTLLVNAVGWRHALYYDAFLGIAIFAWIALIVKDYPDNMREEHLVEQKQIQGIGYFRSMRMAFLRIPNWIAGIYGCLMNLPLSLLGGLWGVLFLVDAHHLSRIDASLVTTMLFVGTIVGAPLVGYLSDRMQLRRAPMMVGAAISLLLILLVISWYGLSFYLLILSFFLLGFFTSTQIISYPYVAENSPRMITAMSVSVVNISVQGGIALFQPFFGYLIDQQELARVHRLSLGFVSSDFNWAMLIFPIGFVIALLAVLTLKETYGKQRKYSKTP